MEEEDVWAGQEEDFIFTRRKQQQSQPVATEAEPAEAPLEEFDWGAVDEDAPRRKPPVPEVAEQEEEEEVSVPVAAASPDAGEEEEEEEEESEEEEEEE